MQAGFSDQQFPGEQIKNAIVLPYLFQWAKVILPQLKKTNQKICYVDGCSGFDNAPLLLLQAMLADPELKEFLIPAFCDREQKNIQKLRLEVAKISGIDQLNFKLPIEQTSSVEDVIALINKNAVAAASLLTINLWDFKGLPVKSLMAALNEANCDALFFFNYPKICAALQNPFLNKSVDALFGPERADKLRGAVEWLQAQQKEELIISTFLEAIKKANCNHFIWFKYLQDGNTCFLIFATGHAKRYRLLKEIISSNCKKENAKPVSERAPVKRNKTVVQKSLFDDK